MSLTSPSIDALYETLHDLRLNSSIFCRADLSSPWAFSTNGAPGAIFHVVVRGSAWLLTEGSDPLALDTGELVVVPSGIAHVMCDDPLTDPVPIAGLATYEEGARIGVLKSGGGGPVTELLCGTFHLDATAERLLGALLPNVLHLRHGQASDWLARTVELIVAELHGGRPGAGLIVDRLADVLMVCILRGYIGSMPQNAGGWLGGLRDDRIGRVLAWLHRDPAQPWTVDALAQRAGMSRSAFYGRFMELVGTSPAAYVASWRVELAQRALREGGSLAAIAQDVGYSSEAALSKAFKRHTGVTPGAWRRQCRAVAG